LCSCGAQPSLTQSVADIFPLTFVNRPLDKSAEVIRSAQSPWHAGKTAGASLWS
jgi:hypothetical protein